MNIKKLFIPILLIMMYGGTVKGQNFEPLSYYFNGTPSNGIKIKTNLPFQNGTGMPTVMLEGFQYGSANTIDIKINWYIYNGVFHIANGSSSGSYSPPVKLANENGKVVIFIDDRQYFTRFNIRVYAEGKGETSNMFEGWTAVDEGINGTNIKDVIYKANFPGKVGIGTIAPGAYQLAVKGKIRAEEIKVETGWADYVFKEGYNLPTLEEVERHIKEKGHLINIPSAEEVSQNGVELGEMNKLLLEKIEELTLYTLQQEKEIQQYQKDMLLLNKKLEAIQQQMNNLKKL
ncbi:tail fiber protein [Muricauda brasiliensis]|uniref:tail fiber protein n=1 Tax=Muricauda brasiliensis TaxID=2162892 RepID=UPI00131EF4E5|nr:tail fiber protein [Muricauda brasiliensis]